MAVERDFGLWREIDIEAIAIWDVAKASGAFQNIVKINHCFQALAFHVEAPRSRRCAALGANRR